MRPREKLRGHDADLVRDVERYSRERAFRTAAQAQPLRELSCAGSIGTEGAEVIGSVLEREGRANEVSCYAAGSTAPAGRRGRGGGARREA